MSDLPTRKQVTDHLTGNFKPSAQSSRDELMVVLWAYADGRVVSLDAMTEEVEYTCRKCRDGADEIHKADNFVSSRRWVTDYEDLTDPLVPEEDNDE